MLKKLLADTAITGAAFFIVSIVGLLLVPVIIAAYGVVGLGLIVLARVLLPAGALGILDFGLSEIATQSVAMARSAGEWGVAKARLWLLAILAAALLAVAALATYVLAAQISQWFKVPAVAEVDFARLIKGTAIALPVLFAGLVFEGVIKGFEKFSVLRTTEIVSTLAYAALVLIGIRLGKDFTWAAWSFLAMQVGRALGLGVIALRMLPAGKGGPVDGAVRQYVLERGRLLFTSRMLGTVQHQAPTLLIGVLVGPAAVGIYDSILRLPRFVKSALSIMGTTLMPAAMRLDAAGDHDRLRAIGRVLISVLPALILPPIAALAVFSGDVLNLWLGRDFVAHAPWLAAYLVVPALNTLVSFQHSTLLNRPEYLRANNRIAVVQTLLQMGLSLVLVRWMGQNAFISGQVVAVLCVFIWQIQLGHSYLYQPQQLRSRFFTFVASMLLGVTACVAVLPAPVFVSSVGAAIAGTFLVAVIWLLAVRYFLTAEGRSILRAVVRIASRPFVRASSPNHGPTPPRNMRRLSIGFVVDHPKRDLPSAVSFARALVERGCNAYLIPLYDQAIDVPLLPLDGIVVNFARPANIDLVTGYRDAGLPVYVLDTEGGNQTEAGTNTPERLAQLLKERGFSERLSGYFFWGPRLRDAFVRSSGMQPDALVATGCPRFDYASKRWRDVLGYPADDYVLVNANFPLVNPRFVTSEAREREAAVQAGWDSDYMARLVEDMSGVFREFMATVARLARDLPNVQFIVRPHPFENQDVYEQAYSGFPNVKVDGTGPVLNVLAHARCLLHLNCATAVEATMLERLPVSMEYLNTPRLLGHAPLPSRISRHAQSYEELFDLVRNTEAHAASFPFDEHYKEMIFPWFFENDGRAADRMADFVIGRAAPAQPSVSLRRSLASSRRDPRLMQRAQALFANLVGSRTASRLRAKFQSVRRDKVFTPLEIEQSISLLCWVEGIALPAVTQARHPVTGLPLASVVCHAPGVPGS